jgi:GMP synthase-like glutamine amidotransferase
MQEVIAKKAIAERDRQYVIIKSQADLESAKNFAEAARILSGSPGAMELRRLEALQNLSAGTSKVIFDLAKPSGGEAAAAAMAAAMGSNVRVADGREIEEEEQGPNVEAARARGPRPPR